jgi:hypothetical protein
MLTVQVVNAQDRPIRDGFTLELGLGAGMMHTQDAGEHHQIGFPSITISLGAFLDDSTALMFRGSGVGGMKESEYKSIGLFYYGGHIQYWLGDNLFIAGGPGLVLFGSPIPFSEPAHLGFGLSVRAGYSFLNLEDHSFRITLEVFPTILREEFLMAEALTIEWQWF